MMEGIASLPTELVYLGWSVVLLILHIVLQGGAATLELGLPYNLTARDEGRRVQGLFAGRAERALRNFLETYPAFIALTLSLAVTDKLGGLGAAGAALWFWARLAYLPLYVFGVPYARSAAWALATTGLVLLLIALLS